jgi:hypothetical protein
MNAHPNTATTQVLLVSEQAAPNLLAALDPKMKPQEAVLMVSAKMARRADALQTVLQESGVKTTQVALADAHDLAALENALMEVASARDGQSITLNVTGGNKLMALAAQSVAQAAGWPAFYVDVDTDQIIWLDKTRPSQALSHQLRLRHYLRGYGYTLAEGIDRPAPNAAWKTLTQELVLDVGSFEGAIGQLNYLSQEAQATLRVSLSPSHRNSHNLDALLRKFEVAHVLKQQGDQVIFPSEDARKFASGGWIEHHVYQTVAQVTGDLAIRDKAANLQVVGPSGQPNEMDVVFLARNRLFVIECKTARMDHPDDTKANDTLYKLKENCSRIGGLGTKGMLVTYRNFKKDRNGNMPEQRLADALGLRVVKGDQLARLGEHLRHWVRPAV